LAVQNDFFTLQSLATFAGAVGATTVIANGCQRAFNFNPTWFALVLSEALCLAVVALSHAGAGSAITPALSDYFVAVINGFLVYCSAGGATGVLNRAAGGEPGPTPPAIGRGTESIPDMVDARPRRRFLSPWF
jgi:hypothetical protein